MHASAKRLLAMMLLAAASGRLEAQETKAPPTPPRPGIDKPSANADKPAPAPPRERPQGAAPPALVQGKPFSGVSYEKVPRNTTEVFTVAPKRLVPPAPRSTNDQVVAVQIQRPVGEGVGKLPDAMRITTTDLIGSATVYYTTYDDQTGETRQEKKDFLVVDEVSDALQNYLALTIKNTYPSVVVDVLVPNSQTAVLSGNVDKAELVQPIIDLVRGFLAARTGAAPDSVNVVNSLLVTGVQQVQLKVIIAEVQRTKARNLGFDWQWADLSGVGLIGTLQNTVGGFIGNQPAVIGQIPTNGSTLVPIPLTQPGAANMPFTVTRPGVFGFNGFLRALVENQLGKILAEPVLVTMSGQPAYFNSGGEVPILSPQGLGNVGIDYKQFGTNLRFVPTVLGDGRIRLEVRPEVSERSDANGIIFQGNLIPGFVTRVAETTVELENGQSFAIAGLIQSRITAVATKTPFLSDMPIFGWAFQDKRYEQRDTELLIIVTPHLVDALDERPCKLPGRESRIPNDCEFYLGSKFEPPCFDDPYRDKVHKHFHGGPPAPLPAAVRPYDNYGLPDFQYPVNSGGKPASELPAPPAPPAPQPPARPTAPLGGFGKIDEQNLVPLPPATADVGPAMNLGSAVSAKITSVDSEEISLEEESDDGKDGWKGAVKKK